MYTLYTYSTGRERIWDARRSFSNSLFFIGRVLRTYMKCDVSQIDPILSMSVRPRNKRPFELVLCRHFDLRFFSRSVEEMKGEVSSLATYKGGVRLCQTSR